MTDRSAALLMVALTLLSQTAPPSVADWRWLDQARDQAFDKLLPVTARPGQVVAYRSHRDLYQDAPERYLRVERDQERARDDRGFVATVVAPVGRSIQQQLLDFHRGRPSAPLATVLTDVAVRRTAVGSVRCPSLAASIDALSGLAITTPRRDLIVLHPTVHHFVIDLGTLRMDVKLFDDDAPLVRWAAEAIAAVQRCGAA